MFVTKLAKVPRSEILNLLPQIRVVKAFQESIKKKKDQTGGKSEKKSEIWKETGDKGGDNRFACFIQKKDDTPEKKNDEEKEKEECRRKRRDSDSDSDDVCSPFAKKKEVQEEKYKERKTIGTQMSPHHEQRTRSAFEISFGNRKYKK